VIDARVVSDPSEKGVPIWVTIGKKPLAAMVDSISDR
jgi:hypothetical protein